MVYLDNAATSWPKPEAMMEAMIRFNGTVGANPGRSGHSLSIEAARVLMDTREALADLFGADDSLRIILTKNATEALNTAIFGMLARGDHVITSGMEHNSVMRPLRALYSEGVEVSTIPCSDLGELDPQDIIPLIRKNTRAVITTHASNVTGTIMPISSIGDITRKNGILLCVDASQTAGAVPIDVRAMNVDLLAFTGHKSLLGPQGTGGLYLREGLEDTIRPLMHGGTGSRSESEIQPDFMPDKYESGTPNTIGIAGLGSGVRFIRETGIETIRRKEQALTSRILAGLESIPGIRIYGVRDPGRQTAIVSFSLAGLSPSDIVFQLDEDFGVMARPGLHCAPSAHKTMGTFPEGTVRFSPGFFTTCEEIDHALDALVKIAGSSRTRRKP
ncbi:aminotransferase class V-fold PLP-dependent enzyme [bacterium]|nr:aminotransferase class V-fold PLP-dependent enzyme [bacterium]